MGGLESCVICLNRQLASDNGQYQYQVFKKIPFFGALKDYQKFFKGIQAIKGQPGTSMFQNIGNIIGTGFPAMQPTSPGMPISPGGGFPPLPQAIINPANLINLKPLDSVKAATSIFDIVGVNDDTFVKKIKKSNYAELVKTMQGTDQKYTDLQFPPNEKSLGNIPGIDNSAIKWMRITEMLKDPVVVSDNIHPNDILQGALGDCYFLSALASLAQQDYRIKNIFPSLEINPNGFYMARVLYNGLYQQVVIDDFFPANKKGDPIFAKPAGKRQIWVMLLQKIWAKLFGSYAEIIGGLPQQVLHAFSSAPVYLKTMPSDSKKQEELWNVMIDAQKNGALLCCGTKNDAKIEQLGFVKGHAYTILGVYDKPFRLIKLRNPWGHKEWTGRASDSDLDFWNQISAADKHALDYEDSKRSKDKDGVFFLLWQDFIKYFQLVDICKINDNAHYNFLESDFQHANAKLFQFQIRGNESNVTYAVTQPNKRGTNKDSYSRSFLALGRWDQQTKTYKYVKSCSDRRMADNYMQVKAAPAGRYVLYAKYLWPGGATNKAVVSVYSESPAQVTEVKGDINSQTFLNNIFYDHATKNPKKHNINQKGDWVCSDILLNEGGFSYVVANVSKDSNTKLGLTLKESQYTSRQLQLLPSLKGRQEIKEQVSSSKPLVVVAELLVPSFPQKITNPTPEIVTLQ